MDKSLPPWYNAIVFYESGFDSMRFSFLPWVITDSITDLTPEFLQSKGIQLLMLDFDNTIVPYTTDIPTDKVADWLSKMAASSIQICVVSNSRKDRVKVFCDRQGIDCITHAKKPFPKGIRACVEKYGLPESSCALVGDQIYTDVLGANSAGVKSILVKAINNHNFWLKARHALEMPWILVSRKRRINHEEFR